MYSIREWVFCIFSVSVQVLTLGNDNVNEPFLIGGNTFFDRRKHLFLSWRHGEIFPTAQFPREKSAFFGWIQLDLTSCGSGQDFTWSLSRSTSSRTVRWRSNGRRTYAARLRRRRRLQLAATFPVISSHWQKSQVCRFCCCCTADSQAGEDQKTDELETFKPVTGHKWGTRTLFWDRKGLNLKYFPTI